MRSHLLSAALLVAMLARFAAAQDVDPKLPKYEPVRGVSGTITAKGSDTMQNMMTLWSGGFREFYPNVRFEVEGQGSSTAIPALIEGSATFGPMSRDAKAGEIDEFEEKFGFKPLQIGVAIDMLAVFVNKDNPIQSMTLTEADAIFSSTRKRGGKQDITSWGQLGLTGAWGKAPISLYGRNSASGTYGFFKDEVMLGGDFKSSVKEQPGSSAVVQGVSTNKFGIGYSGIGYKTADVRALPLAKDAKSKPVSPANENVDDYPLSRFLYLAVNYKPGSELAPLRREFLKYVFSQDGQVMVVKDGYLPVPAPLAKRVLKQVGIE